MENLGTQLPSNTTTIARNSLWFGLERAIDFAVSLFASIAIARSLGPEQLGYFAYFTWLTGAVSRVGDLGISSATRKYMAEYWGRRDLGATRAVFHCTMRWQVVAAGAATLIGVAGVAVLGDPSFRLVLVALVLSMLPSIVNSVPAQANIAMENMAANLPGSLASTAVYLVAVALSLSLNWGLLGLAAGMLAMRAVDLVVRLAPLGGQMRLLPKISLPASVVRKMVVYSSHSLVLLLLTIVVWDRSEILFLKHFSGDIRQVAFYSLAFGISQNTLMIPWILGHAIGASLMAQAGRDHTQLGNLVSAAVRYLTLVTLPVFLGLAALAEPVVRLAYGTKYLDVAPVLVLSLLLAIPKAFLLPAQHLLQATDNQGFLVRWLLLTAAFNLLLGWLFIPGRGAVAAALVNGAAQLFAVSGLWTKAIHISHVRLPVLFLVRVAAASLVMAGLVFALARHLPPAAAICSGVVLGFMVFVLMLRVTGSLERQDWQRVRQLRSQVPSHALPWLDRGIAILIPAAQSRTSEG